MDDLASPGPQVEQGETNEPRVPHRLFALKDGDTFVVADAYGDILGVADGLFHNDTRVLSYYRLLLGNRPPSLLSAAIATAWCMNRPRPAAAWCSAMTAWMACAAPTPSSSPSRPTG